MSARPVSSRQRQTHLRFTPLPSSSPQRPNAYVRVDEVSSPTKKRRIDMDSSLDLGSPSTTQLPFNSFRRHNQVVADSPSRHQSQLPTPQASSQVEMKAEQEVTTENLSSGHSGVTGTSKSTSKSRRIQRKLDFARTTATWKPQNEAPPEASNDEETVAFPTKSRKPRCKTLSSSDESGPISPTSHRVPRAERSSSSPQPATNNRPMASRRPSTRNFLLGGSSGAAPISRTQGRKKASPPKKYRRSERLKSFEEESDTSEDESSDAEPVHIQRRRSLRSSVKGQPLASTAKSHISLRLSERKSPYKLEGSDDEDVDIIVTPRRKLVRPQASSRDTEDGADLDGELADLRDTDNELRQTRTRGKPAASERNRRLEKLNELRRRRKGAVSSEEDESEEDEMTEGHLNDGLEPTDNIDNLEDLDEYEQDFVVDDIDEPLGVDLVQEGVALEFTRHANLKPIEYFRYEVEWMIHNKLNPAFSRNSQIYELAHKKLDDEVKGHAGSTFKSSVWTPAFTIALQSRPDLFVVDLPAMFELKCEACNRSKHTPTQQLTFSGQPYDTKTLEPTFHDSDSDSQQESQSQASEDPEVSFALGRFCCANAQIAHTLYHWRYNLNQTVLDLLDRRGHFNPEQLVRRERWNHQKREKFANRVVDGLVDNGEMKELYSRFKQDLEAARSAKAERFTNG